MRGFLFCIAMVILIAINSGCTEFKWITPPPPAPTIEPEVVPSEEVGDETQLPAPVPPCQMIKGNINSSGEKIFHVPGGRNYNQVKINEETGETWFCTEQEAEEAGFRKATN